MENVLPSGQMQCAIKPSVGKIIRYQHPTNYMDTLKTVESAKYLGCTFTSDLRWNDHVNNGAVAIIRQSDNPIVRQSDSPTNALN